MYLAKVFQYFTVAGFINAFILSLLLLLNQKNHLAKIFMVGLVMIVTFQAILNAFDNRDFFLAYPHLSKISWLTPSLFGPLVYLFTIKLCSVKPAFQSKDLVHFIPFTLYLILLLPWFMQTADVKRDYLNDFNLASKDDFGFLNQLSIFIILLYLIFTLIYLKRYRRQIENTFSELSRKRVEWMSRFAYAVLVILVISALGFYGQKWRIPVIDAIYHYNYALVILLVYWIGYKALLQPVIFEFPTVSTRDPEVKAEGFPENHDNSANQQSFEREKEKYVRSGLEDKQSELMYMQLMKFMKDEKPYLNPEINIYELAGQLNMKKHHLSQVINEKADMNFFDFINAFRVEEIKKNLVNPSLRNLTLLGIALESGFNSKATFNAAFKKFTGLTPSAYQKSLRNQV